MSNIKVSVAWDTPTTFAGEEIKCTITFRNTAPDPSQVGSQQQQQQRHNHHHHHNTKLRPLAPSSSGTGGLRNEWSSAPRSGRPSIALSDTSKKSGHRQTVSLNNPTTRRLSSVPNTPVIPENSPTTSTRGSRTPKQSHKRSISIVSYESVEGPKERDAPPNSANSLTSPRRSPHARAASYSGPSSKGAPSPNPSVNGMLSPKVNGGGIRSPRAPPLVRAATAGAAKTFTHDFPPGSARSPLLQTNEEEETDSVADDTSQTTENAPSAVGRAISAPMRQRPFPSPLPHRDKLEHHSLQRIISPLGTEATPRSSIDMMSTYSEDTLASEYPQSSVFRFASQRHSRQASQIPPAPTPAAAAAPEHLMMGYVQLQGSFVLDASLVDHTPFEAVKQMGVIGGQGSGGVVGVGTTKRSSGSGFLSSFGFSSFGSSIGGILGGSEMSSMREMKGQADKKAIPIVSTPQSVLFVDLQLAPGQRKSFTYTHMLPRDLPPTHKGRAVKIEYQLTIGTQRVQTVGQKNNVKQVDIPFRVFPGISQSGALYPHNLMEPHVLLRDQAETHATDERKPPKKAKAGSFIRSKNAFLAYTEQLLQSSLNSNGEALLSPTEARRESRILLSEESDESSSSMSMRDLIDQTVTRPMLLDPSSRSSNQFSIQRSGSPVAVISLPRPFFRLGETVTAAVDLTPAASHIFALHATLESEELVDESIALRSGASIRRATRRIHAHATEATPSQARAVFRFMLPWAATPDFATSGVRLEWRLRIEFVCSAYPKARRHIPAAAPAPRTPKTPKTPRTPRTPNTPKTPKSSKPGPGEPAEKELQRRQQRRNEESSASEDGGNGSGSGSGRTTGETDERDRYDDDDHYYDDDDSNDNEHAIVDYEGEELMEEISRDERGVVLAALQEVHCESFEVGVPIRVFGADGGSGAGAGVASAHAAHAVGRPDVEISI